MLTVSRIILRQFQQVLRKAGLLKSTRQKLSSSVRLYADHGGLTLRSQNADVSVSLSMPGIHEPVELVLPMTCLLDSSQRTEGDVQFGQDNNKITAAWTDQGVPVIQEYEPIAPADFPQIPALPTDWSENDGRLLTALAAAIPCTDPDSTRYAMGCLQLDGSRGQIAATDGRQALVQRGFTFPWAEPVLIPACPIFTSPQLPRKEMIHIGKTDQHVVLLIGPWTITLRIAEGRFPEVERIIPAEAAVRTRVTLDPADVTFLQTRLDQLPQEDPLHRPVTLDLNGSVAIRARPGAEKRPTELVLSRSRRVGDELRLNTDRRLLRRALDLGFTELEFTSNTGPAVCRDGHREFVWALLDAESAISPTEQAQRVESHTTTTTPNRVSTHLAASPPKPTRTRSPTSPSANQANVSLATSQPTPTQKAIMPAAPPAISTEAELVTQLLDLRKQLRTMEAALVAIARQLRARRKQQQLMKSTLASLKQLQTLGV